MTWVHQNTYPGEIAWANARDSATVAHPTETIKCKLQLQLVRPANIPREFSGPIDVVKQTIQVQGVTGMFKGLGASFMYRSSFVAMFGGTCLHPLVCCCAGYSSAPFNPPEEQESQLTRNRVRDLQPHVSKVERNKLGIDARDGELLGWWIGFESVLGNGVT